MSLMTIISSDIASRLPGLYAASFRADGLPAYFEPQQLNPTVELANQSIANIDIDTLANHPAIECWRQAYRTMGLKPGDYRSSVEQLVRRTLRGGSAQTGIPMVDLYNLVSIAFLAPMGAYDIAKLSPAPVELRIADPASDRFDPIGGDANRFPLTTEIGCYAQGETILCWALNHRDSENSSLSAASSSALFVSEATDKLGRERTVSALSYLRSILMEFAVECGEIAQFEQQIVA